MNRRRTKKYDYLFKSCKRSQFKQYCQKLKRKEKSYWNLEQSQKQEPNNYEIDQFQSISSSGRTYPLKIPHGRTRIYTKSSRTTQALRTTHFEGEGNVRSLYYQCNPLLLLVEPPYYIDIPMQCPYCYYCAPQKPTIVIIVPLHYYCYVGSDYIMTPQTPIYRKEVLSFVSSKNCSFM